MTPPPYLTRTERMVAERVLRAAGAVQTAAHHDVWKIVNGWGELVYIDLREVFPTPFTAQQPGARVHLLEAVHARPTPGLPCPREAS